MSKDKKDEEIIEEADTALTSEEDETENETNEEPADQLETTEDEAEETIEEAPEEEKEEELEEAFEEFADETETIEEEEEPIEEAEVEKAEEVDVEEEVEAEEEEVIELETEPSEELDIPAIPMETEVEEEEPEEELTIPEDEAIEAEVIDDEEIFEAKVKKKKKSNWPLFWIGLAIGLIVAVGAEVLFTIPYWNTGTSSPDLYYIEVVVLLIAFMIPGMLSRSIQKGILGGFILFAVSFGLPFLMQLLGYVVLNPMTPLLASTQFTIDAYAVFQSMFNLTLDLSSVTLWIWAIDLFLMFILMVIVVTLTSWLIKNVTLPKKKVGHWIGIPFLSIGIIVFVIFMPIVLSSTYGIIHASTSFLAGSSIFVDGLSTFQNSNGSLQTLQNNQTLEDGLFQAGKWFNISYVHYDGLRNIGVINFAALVAGQYRPLIEAGDQLALATLAFTQVLYPLFLGIAAITDSLNNATSNLVNFGTSSSSSSAYGDNVMGIQAVNQTKLDELKNSILSTVTSLENAEAALGIVRDKLEEANVLGAFDEAEALLGGITTETMLPAIGNVINDIRNQLSGFKGHLIGFTDFINFTANALVPTKEILWTSYYALVGNEYLKNYDFINAYDAYDNATEHVALIDLDGYTAPSTLGDVFSVQITEGFSTMLEDLVNLMDPLLNEEKHFAETYIGINTNLDLLASNDYNISEVDFSLTTIDTVNISADLTRSFGYTAQTQADALKFNLENNTYGSFFNTTGGNFYKTLTDDFKAADFGEKTYALVQVISYMFRGCEEYSLSNFGGAQGFMAQANLIMQTEIAGNILPGTPIYFEEYLLHWNTSIIAIKDTIDTELDLSTGVNEIMAVLTILHTDTAEKL